MQPDHTIDAVKNSAPVGPGSLLWKYLGDRRTLLFLGRTGLMQNMHPAVGAALIDHSNFFDDPWGRLFRSVPQIAGMIYDEGAVSQTQRVRDFHKDLKGTDSRGYRYHALNPDVYWWTHVTFIETIIAMNKFFGTPLSATEKDQLVAEGVTWWRRYGLSDRVAIDNYADFKKYWLDMQDSVLEANATTDFAMSLSHQKIAAPPAVPDFLWSLTWRPSMSAQIWLSNALMPERCREILGMRWTQADEVAFLTFAQAIKLAWPLLPDRLKYLPRAWEGMQRVASNQ